MYQDVNDLLGGTALSPPRRRIVKGAMTHDNMMTFDSNVIDSTGAFFIGELERLDQTLHMPLVEFSWGRDIDIRTDVSIADEISSWTNSDFAAMGNMGGQGNISWIGKDSNTIQGVSLDIGKTAQPLHLWGQEIKYTIPELESAMKLGRPVDAQNPRLATREAIRSRPKVPGLPSELPASPATTHRYAGRVISQPPGTFRPRIPN